MTLGRFGGAGQKVKFRSGGGGAPGGVSLADVARDLQAPTPEGNPAATQQLATNAVSLRFNDVVGDTNLTASLADIVTRTYTPAVAVDVLVLGKIIFQEKASCIAGQAEAEITYDGTRIEGSDTQCYLTLIGANTNYNSVVVIGIQTGVTAASHTFALRALAPVSGGGNQWVAAGPNVMTILEMKR